MVLFTLSYTYPFCWAKVNSFVDRQKRGGKTAYDRVHVTMAEDEDKNLSVLYDITVPWALRCYVDVSKQLRTEIGENITWSHKKRLQEVTTWRPSDDGKSTVYYKEVNIELSWVPDAIIHRALSIVKHYSLKTREQEMDAMREYFASSKRGSVDGDTHAPAPQ